MNRVIKNGKLDICVELIGGAHDGLLVNGDLEYIRMPKRKPLPTLFGRCNRIPSINDLEYDVYKRISNEKAILI